MWSFCSIANPESFDQIREAIDDSIRDARQGTKDRIDLYPSAACKSKINFPVLSEPGIEQMLEIGSQCDEIIAEVPRIIRSTVNPWYAVNSKYFVSSEGSQILQNFYRHHSRDGGNIPRIRNDAVSECDLGRQRRPGTDNKK